MSIYPGNPGITNDQEKHGKYPGILRTHREHMYFKYKTSGLFQFQAQCAKLEFSSEGLRLLVIRILHHY